jgi:hypothetical protein
MAMQARGLIDGMGRTHKHFLRIATALGTGPSKGPVIDLCDGPAGVVTPTCGYRTAASGSYDEQIVRDGHNTREA